MSLLAFIKCNQPHPAFFSDGLVRLFFLIIILYFSQSSSAKTLNLVFSKDFILVSDEKHWVNN